MDTQRLHQGGPVPGPLVCLHTHHELGDSEIIPGVFFTLGDDDIAKLAAAGPRPVRYFAGYAGWGRGQLEGELQVGSWLTVAAQSRDIFEDDGALLWRDVFRRASGSNDAFPRDDAGVDPSLN